MERIIPYILENKRHVWNHQPVIQFSVDCYIIWFCWLSVVNITLSVVHYSSKAVYILYHVIWLNYIDSQSCKILSSYGHVGMIPHIKAISNLKWLKCFLGVGSPIEPWPWWCCGKVMCWFTIIHQWDHLLRINQQWFASCQNDKKKKQPTTLWLWLT